MKKYLWMFAAILAVFCLLFTFSACGGGDDNLDDDDDITDTNDDGTNNGDGTDDGKGNGDGTDDGDGTGDDTPKPPEFPVLYENGLWALVLEVDVILSPTDGNKYSFDEMDPCPNVSEYSSLKIQFKAGQAPLKLGGQIGGHTNPPGEGWPWAQIDYFENGIGGAPVDLVGGVATWSLSGKNSANWPGSYPHNTDVKIGILVDFTLDSAHKIEQIAKVWLE